MLYSKTLSSLWRKTGLNRIIPFIIRACLSNKSFPCSEGQQYRDFIHIEQIIDAFIKILNPITQKEK